MTLKGHFDGKVIVLDEAPPAELESGRVVDIHFLPPQGDAPKPQNNLTAGEKSWGQALLDLAIKRDDLPTDFAEQHEHYVKGTPRR